MRQLKTDFLCEPSAFMTGMGSVLNIGGYNHLYNVSEHPDETAIRNDWRMVGQDIRNALDKAAVEFAQDSPCHERKQAA